MKIKNYTFLLLPFISMANLQAQDYLISFAGSGASTTVTTVKIENLTQGTNLTMSGSNVLHLMSTITGIETISQNQNRNIIFSPNPMIDRSLMRFDLPESGTTIIDLYDIAGRKITEKQDLLSKGQHTYSIQGINKGVYFVKISLNRYSVSGRLVCTNSTESRAKILFENSIVSSDLKGDIVLNEKEKSSKGINTETLMQYTFGDRLKLTSSSGNYSTVVIDIPTTSKTITFNHVFCTDEDANNYSVVQIDAQTWMAENLRTTKYNDGTLIPNVTVDATWAAQTTGAYCDYANSPTNSTIYGKMYNWYAVDNNTATKVASNGGKNVCPIGWHVPSVDEWTVLSNYLGGLLITGSKIRELGTTHWMHPGTDATNETGFTALPGGWRYGNEDPYPGQFDYLGYYGFWWTVTDPNINTYAWNYKLYCAYSRIEKAASFKSYGFSVRCVKDN